VLVFLNTLSFLKKDIYLGLTDLGGGGEELPFLKKRKHVIS
jgi:hypothetical protein